MRCCQIQPVEEHLFSDGQMDAPQTCRDPHQERGQRSAWAHHMSPLRGAVGRLEGAYELLRICQDVGRN